MIQFLGRLGMCFDAAVVFIINSSILLKFAMTILCSVRYGLSVSLINNFNRQIYRSDLPVVTSLLFMVKMFNHIFFEQ